MKKNEKVFALETKLGQKVYDIRINIIPNPRRSSTVSVFDSEGIFIDELKIVYQSQYKIALSGDWIPVLDRRKFNEKKESYKHFLEEIGVSIKTKETYFNNGIFAQCYTLQNPEKIIKKMTAEIAIKVEKEYGFLSNLNVWDKVGEMKITKK